MLIFDKFGTKEKAERFAIQTRDVCFASARICASQEESNRYSPFPHKLTPPIVLVQRWPVDAMDGWISQAVADGWISEAVAVFGGRFAGRT
jgi:hypothetical protein